MTSLADNYYKNTMKKGKRMVIEKWVCDKCRLYFSDDFDDVCRHEDMCSTGISNDDNSEIILNAQTNTPEPKVEIEETLNMIEPSLSSSSTFCSENSNEPHAGEGRKALFPVVHFPPKQRTTFSKEVISFPNKNNLMKESLIRQVTITDQTKKEKDKHRGLSFPFRQGPNKDTSIHTKSSNTNEDPPSEIIHNVCAEAKEESRRESGRYNLRRSTRSLPCSKALRSLNQSLMTAKGDGEKENKKNFNKQSSKIIKIDRKRNAKVSTKTLKRSVTSNCEDPDPASTSSKRKSKRAKNLVNMKSSTGTRSLASIFQDTIPKTEINPQIIAENRVAEFALKRRAALKSERIKQVKRETAKREHAKQKLRDTQKNESKNVKGLKDLSDHQTNHNEGMTRETLGNSSISCINSSAQISLSRKVLSTTSADSIARSSCSLRSRFDSFPPAIRFPILSHRGLNIELDTHNMKNKFLSAAVYRTLIETSKYQKGSSDTLHVFLKKSVDIVGLLRNVIVNEEKSCLIRDDPDALYQSFAKVLRPPPLIVGNGNTSDAPLSQIFPDKYTIKNVPNDVCSTRNKEGADKLIGFINEWRDHRQTILKSRLEKTNAKWGIRNKGKTSTLKRFKDDDGDFMDSDLDDEDGLSNVFLLTGCPGSGKTSLVHACAKNCQCIVIEINTSIERGGQALKRAIEESTQSHSSFALLKCGSSPESESNELEVDEKRESASLAVILIDEADLIFENEGDTGFWQALSNLTKKAKCPIILTANTTPQALSNSSIRYETFSISKPTPTECMSKMSQIVKEECMSWNYPDISVAHKYMAAVAKLCNCDLRKIANEMHLFKHAIMNRNVSNNIPAIKSVLMSTETKQLQLLNDAAFVQHPFIASIIPSVVPSDQYSVIAIKGNNFFEYIQKFKITKVTVSIGKLISPEVRIINSSLILAVCPPCFLPDNVNSFGIFKNTLFEECLTAKYAPVVVTLHSETGLILRSNTSVSRVNADGSYCNIPHVSFIFPECSDSLYDSVFRESKFSSNQSSNVNEGTGENVTTIDCEEKIPLFKDMLDQASNTMMDSTDVSLSQVIPTMHTKGSLHTRNGVKGEFVKELHGLMKCTELSSDAALIEDSFKLTSIPLLSGAVTGFGSEMVNDPNLLRNGNGKPPSNDKIFSSGWNDSCFYFGCSDSYLTRPNSRRDKYLLANSLNHSRGLAKFHTESNTSNLSSVDESNQMSLDEKQVQLNILLNTSVEDDFLPSYVSPHLLCLPQVLFTTAAKSCSTHKPIASEVEHFLEDREKVLNATKLKSLVLPILGDYCFIHENEHHQCNKHYMTDHISVLRDMSHFEEIAQQRFLELAKSMNEKKNMGRTRRSTRRGLRHEHYFDSILDTFGSRENTGQSQGGLLGRKLSDMQLKYTRISN